MNDDAKRTASADLTAEEIAELRRLERAATPGPWLACEAVACTPDGTVIVGLDPDDRQDETNVEFIALCRTLVPRLLDMVERQRATPADDPKQHPALKGYLQQHRDEAYQGGWDDGYAEGHGKALAARQSPDAGRRPKTIAELQAEIGRLQSQLAGLVLGDPRIGVSSIPAPPADEAGR